MGNCIQYKERTRMQELVHNAEATIVFQGADQSGSCLCEHCVIQNIPSSYFTFKYPYALVSVL